MCQLCPTKIHPPALQEKPSLMVYIPSTLAEMTGLLFYRKYGISTLSCMSDGCQIRRDTNQWPHQINELKRTWNQEQDDVSGYSPRPTPSHTVDGSSLLFEQVKPLERMEIVSTLPPKHEIDRLIAIFFNRQAFPIAIPRK